MLPISDSMHVRNAMILARIAMLILPEEFRRLDSSEIFRFKFPPNAFRTDRFEVFGPTDLASGHSASTSRCHRVVRIGETESKISVKP